MKQKRKKIKTIIKTVLGDSPERHNGIKHQKSTSKDEDGKKLDKILHSQSSDITAINIYPSDSFQRIKSNSTVSTPASPYALDVGVVEGRIDILLSKPPQEGYINRGYATADGTDNGYSEKRKENFPLDAGSQKYSPAPFLSDRDSHNDERSPFPSNTEIQKDALQLDGQFFQRLHFYNKTKRKIRDLTNHVKTRRINSTFSMQQRSTKRDRSFEETSGSDLDFNSTAKIKIKDDDTKFKSYGGPEPVSVPQPEPKTPKVVIGVYSGQGPHRGGQLAAERPRHNDKAITFSVAKMNKLKSDGITLSDENKPMKIPDELPAKYMGHGPARGGGQLEATEPSAEKTGSSSEQQNSDNDESDKELVEKLKKLKEMKEKERKAGREEDKEDETRKDDKNEKEIKKIVVGDDDDKKGKEEIEKELKEKEEPVIIITSSFVNRKVKTHLHPSSRVNVGTRRSYDTTEVKKKLNARKIIKKKNTPPSKKRLIDRRFSEIGIQNDDDRFSSHDDESSCGDKRDLGSNSLYLKSYTRRSGGEGQHGMGDMASHIEEHHQLQEQIYEKAKANEELMHELSAQKECHGKLSAAVCEHKAAKQHLANTVSAHEGNCHELEGSVECHQKEQKLLTNALDEHKEHNERLEHEIQCEKEKEDHLKEALSTLHEEHHPCSNDVGYGTHGDSYGYPQHEGYHGNQGAPIGVGNHHGFSSSHGEGYEDGGGHGFGGASHHVAPCGHGASFEGHEGSNCGGHGLGHGSLLHEPCAQNTGCMPQQSHTGISEPNICVGRMNPVPPHIPLQQPHEAVEHDRAPLLTGTYDHPDIIRRIDSGYPVFNIPQSNSDVIIPEYHKPLPPLYGLNPYEVLTSSELNGTVYKMQHYDPNKMATGLAPGPVQKDCC